ncbi:spore coat protein JB [Seinonella peptonophila]|uniref:Spore coat protein JB n=1 Tax=Seinonella peptonophila TaxID=112248 RepID=A0A1M4T975_9BACL|nr:spore coat protein CotJB [Seinonella peptonophila]SHE40888.1 spore coat protein JB [Seinonella peptonophila]
MSENRKKILLALQEVDFVLVELNLYLDTHPFDQNAIDQYNHYAKERRKIAEKYEEYYGPLTNFGHSPMTISKEWSKGPWPWEV